MRFYGQMVSAVVTGLLVAATGCTANQRTPEPHETERVEELITELGTTYSYDSETLLPNRAPDGRILQSWIGRRRDTLDGTLAEWKTPADFNPGSIAATLAWERRAMSEDGRRLTVIEEQRYQSAVRNAHETRDRAFQGARESRSRAKIENEQRREQYANEQRRRLSDIDEQEARAAEMNEEMMQRMTDSIEEYRRSEKESEFR